MQDTYCRKLQVSAKSSLVHHAVFVTWILEAWGMQRKCIQAYASAGRQYGATK
jgi:hypothetical protein